MVFRVSTFFLALIALTSVAQSQTFEETGMLADRQFSINLNSVSTRSIRGWKSGLSMELDYKKRWELNYTYLTSVGRASEDRDALMGLQISWYFLRVNAFRMGASVRTSVFNQRFVQVLPMVKSEVDLGERFVLGTAFTESDGYPFFQFELGFRLISK